jgi:hypothetical protein
MDWSLQQTHFVALLIFTNGIAWSLFWPVEQTIRYNSYLTFVLVLLINL